MELVKYEMELEKNGKEVVDFLDAVLEKVLAKKGLADFADLLDEAYKAVDGINEVKEGLSSQYRDELAGYLVHKVLGRLLPVKEDASA